METRPQGTGSRAAARAWLPGSLPGTSLQLLLAVFLQNSVSLAEMGSAPTCWLEKVGCFDQSLTKITLLTGSPKGNGCCY